MKKRIFILFASIILTVTATYANSHLSHIPETVISEFRHDFSYSKNVNWEMIGNYYKASFNEHGMTFYAFYTEDADLMGIATSLPADRLPATLLSKIKVKYSSYWISDLYSLNINNTPGYFITVENADQKIMLKTDGNTSWVLFAVEKK
jgi:hypothetical protein